MDIYTNHSDFSCNYASGLENKKKTGFFILHDNFRQADRCSAAGVCTCAVHVAPVAPVL